MQQKEGNLNNKSQYLYRKKKSKNTISHLKRFTIKLNEFKNEFVLIKLNIEKINILKKI